MNTFGTELRRERELREISLIEVAEATKINIRFLEAMERNDFTSLPGGLYNRGIVRAYSQFIGADPEAMVNAYLLQEQTGSAVGGATGPALFRGSPGAELPREPAGPEAGRRPGVPARWILAAVIAALLVAALLLFIRFSGGAGAAGMPALPGEKLAGGPPTGGTAHGGDLG